jgi:hypothetical protein
VAAPAPAVVLLPPGTEGAATQPQPHPLAPQQSQQPGSQAQQPLQQHAVADGSMVPAVDVTSVLPAPAYHARRTRRDDMQEDGDDEVAAPEHSAPDTMTAALTAGTTAPVVAAFASQQLHSGGAGVASTCLPAYKALEGDNEGLGSLVPELTSVSAHGSVGSSGLERGGVSWEPPPAPPLPSPSLQAQLTSPVNHAGSNG